MSADPFDRAWYAPLDPPGWDTGVDAHRVTFPEPPVVTRLVIDLATAKGATEAFIRLSYGLPPPEAPKTRHSPVSGAHTRRTRQPSADETTREAR